MAISFVGAHSMTERPILMSAPMVLATLRAENPKTQTRRVVKYPTPEGKSGWHPTPTGFQFLPGGSERPVFPYGQPGDQLWVKETIVQVGEDGAGRIYSAYKADEQLTKADAWPWQRPQLNSIHCPRGLSRIQLEITGRRVERLQDISETDAIAEGISSDHVVVGANCNGGVHQEETALRFFFPGCRDDGYESGIDAYEALWRQLNPEEIPLLDDDGRKIGMQPNPARWDANPWVWVVEFRRIKP